MGQQFHVRRGPAWGARLGEAMSGWDGSVMEWMERHTRVLKSNSHSKVGLLELDGQACYLKFYRSKSWGQHALFKLGVARGFRSYDCAFALLDKQVAVPEPLSCVLVPRGMVLLTRAIEPAIDLKAQWLDGPNADFQLQLMEKAGRALRKLHAAGYCHGDCKWSNFVWSQGQFYFVDLEAVEVTSGDLLSNKKQARDIARFVLNAEDLSVPEERFEYFLRSYLEQSTVTKKALTGAIMPVLDRLRRRHQRNYGARGARLL